jgi:hypothetical protein
MSIHVPHFVGLLVVFMAGVGSLQRVILQVLQPIELIRLASTQQNVRYQNEASE